MGEPRYSVKQLARLAGVSVRTLHVYDKMGLLKPSVRTDARYRYYGEAELLRLQQILFYKELDLSLKAIGEIINEPGFDLIAALNCHKAALTARRDGLDTLLNTIDNTIDHLKNKTMSNFDSGGWVQGKRSGRLAVAPIQGLRLLCGRPWGILRIRGWSDQG
jgi:DNA-binding transcriptional MerR regulator